MTPIKALNIFSHGGGLAEGFKGHGVDCVAYTTLIEDLKISLENKFKEGSLSKGQIYKFSHQIKPSCEKVDLLFGLIQHPAWQRRELRREWDDMKSLEDLSPEEVHRRTLHEVMIVQKCCKAQKVILFFTYNPFHSSLDTMKIFYGTNVWMRCFQVALLGEYVTPARYIYILEINCEPCDTKEIIFMPSLSLHVKIPTTVVQQSSFSKHQLMWDLSPWLVSRCIEEVEKVDEGELKKNLLTIYSSSIQPKNETLGDQIPKRNSLGWSDELLNQL